MVLMLLVVACYTVCGLSDKYSVAKLKFDGNSCLLYTSDAADD